MTFGAIPGERSANRTDARMRIRKGAMMRDYHINVFWSEDDERYVADIPDLMACSALGSTPQEAVEQVIIAKEAWMEAARARDRPIPKPTYRPLIYQAAH